MCGSGCGCVHMYTFISRYFLVENENENGESRIDCMMAWKIDDNDDDGDDDGMGLVFQCGISFPVCGVSFSLQPVALVFLCSLCGISFSLQPVALVFLCSLWR